MLLCCCVQQAETSPGCAGARWNPEPRLQPRSRPSSFTSQTPWSYCHMSTTLPRSARERNDVIRVVPCLVTADAGAGKTWRYLPLEVRSRLVLPSVKLLGEPEPARAGSTRVVGLLDRNRRRSVSGPLGASLADRSPAGGNEPQRAEQQQVAQPTHTPGWQHPYVNIFKHVKVEEWKKSAKEGDVSSHTVTTATHCPARDALLYPRTLC
ncbi:WD repeat-containing protein 90 [Liparis tanakae]|uniref:WD repeat-containing protein 90 n=1 Tax=Liparis tanakae TaxID=230148 RepID=A0A4Z2EFQ8_9TELE|nr:WD repeat-containing protein 90 [Liparis tanakae]